MAFGSAPDISGNNAVGPFCASTSSTCDTCRPNVQPNPNGAFPTNGSAGGDSQGNGNGSEGSPGLGFPPSSCPPQTSTQ